MKKGIVLEVHDEHVTILTPEGEFLKSRKQKGQVSLGEEIVFFPLHRAETAKKGRLASALRWKWAVISVMTVVILALTLYPRYESNQVYAYVSVDVNPSIELGINKDMKVISMDAYNKEGEDILKQLKDWEKQDITTVSSQIFDIFRQQGFLKEDSEVLIASVLSNEAKSGWKTLMQDKITTISKKIQEEKVSITTLETTIKDRSDAIKEGISPGKYMEKEQKTELVDSEDTSKTEEPAPTMPLNQTPVEIKHSNATEEKSGPPSFVEIKKSEKEAEKNERKEWQEQQKIDKREQQEDWKQEKKEWKEEREEKREDRKQKGKEQREDKNQLKEENRADWKQDNKGNKDNKDYEGNNRSEQEKKGPPSHAKPNGKDDHHDSNKGKKNHEDKKGNDR